MKKQLLDKATAIHTVKVAKTLDNDKVKSSLAQIGVFRTMISGANTEEYNKILNEINNWAATSPVVTERDILELRPNLR